MSRSILLIGLAISAAGACGGDAATGSGRPGDAVVRFQVTNSLAAPVTIAIDNSTSLILESGASGSLAVSPAAQWLTWTSAKATDSANTPIPDDIGNEKVRVSGIQSVLELTNIINDTTFITANILNQTSTRVSIGVYEGGAMTCVSVLHGASGSAAGFTKIGYYRLLPTTEIRAYADPSHCTGPYVAWRGAQLGTYAPKTGTVNLVLSAVP